MALRKPQINTRKEVPVWLASTATAEASIAGTNIYGIQKKLNVRELDMMQIAAHPLLTAAPTVHPLINAAHAAPAKLRAGARS